jgi:acetyltransferase-like isoleucine patch superfamily enzyme
VTPELVGSDRATGLMVAPGTTIPADAEIAPWVTIHAGVVMGAGVLLSQGAIIGRPQQIDGRSRTPISPAGDPTVLGARCSVGSYSIVTAGAQVGPGSRIGDHVLVRERAVVEEEAVVGQGSVIGRGSRIGPRARLQAQVVVGPGTVLEEDVFVSARVTFVGDPTMGRGPTGSAPGSVVARRGSRIAVGAIIIPPAELGEESVVGAGSLVRSHVPPRTVVAGTPARHLRPVRDDELLR